MEEIELFIPELKIFLYFRKELTGPKNQSKNLSQKSFSSLVMFL